jgi:hypothetical protein
MQYVQQGLKQILVRNIQDDNLVGRMIGFDDQTPNQRMAKEGSRKGNLATLDLSEASDRVSNQLVRVMMRGWPHFGEAVQASRSRKAAVPGAGVIRLSKFASMGSALTFPVEAMVFLTVVFCGIEKTLNRPITRRDLFRLSRVVRVYGDDIIVPTHMVQSVIESLEAYGFRVSTDKSFWNGRFRESCGGDYYDGVDVTPARCRRRMPSSRSDASEVISAVSLRNQFYKLGLWKSASYLDSLIEKVLDHYPVVDDTSPVLGRLSFLGYQAEAGDSTLHTPLVRGYVVKTRLPDNPLDDVPALLKFLLKEGDEPLDEEHLERSGRPDAVTLKLRWAQPF